MEAPSSSRIQQRMSSSDGSSSRSSTKSLIGELVRQRAGSLCSFALFQRRAADAAWRCLLQPSVHCSSSSSSSNCISSDNISSSDSEQQEERKLRLLQQQQLLLLQQRTRDSEFLSLAATAICGDEEALKGGPAPPLSHLQKPLLLLLLLANAAGGGVTPTASAADETRPHRESLRLKLLKLLQQHQQHGLQQYHQQQQNQLQHQQLIRPKGEHWRSMNGEELPLFAASTWGLHQGLERGPFGGFTRGPLRGPGADMLCQATAASAPHENLFGVAQLQPMQLPPVCYTETHSNPTRPAAAAHSAAAAALGESGSKSSSNSNSNSSSWLRRDAISDLIGGAPDALANMVEEGAPSGSPDAGSSIFASMRKALCSIDVAAATAEQQRFVDQHELLRQPSRRTPRGLFASTAMALETISNAAPAAAAAAAGVDHEAADLKQFLALALREDSNVTLKGGDLMEGPQQRGEAWDPPREVPRVEGRMHLLDRAFFSHLPEEALLSFDSAVSHAPLSPQGAGRGEEGPPRAPFQQGASVAADAWIAATRPYMSPEARLALLPHTGAAAAAAASSSLAEAALGGTLAGFSQRLQEARGVAWGAEGPTRRGGPSAAPQHPVEEEQQQATPDRQETQVLQVSWPLRMTLRDEALSGHEGKLPHGTHALPRWAQSCCIVLLGAPSPLFPLVSVCCCSSKTNPEQQQEQQMLLPETYVQLQEVLLATACSSANSSSSSSDGCCPGSARPFFAAADFRCSYEALLTPNSAAAAAVAAACEAAGPWRAGTALLSHLLKATAELQHVMPPPLPQQQQQQQRVQEERPFSPTALALRLLEATIPSFLHAVTRCCFAGVLDDVAFEFSTPVGGPLAEEGFLEASKLGAPRPLLLLPKPLASLEPLVERCLKLQLLLQQCDVKAADAARLLPQQQQRRSGSSSSSNGISCVNSSKSLDPEKGSEPLCWAPSALGFSDFFARVRHLDLHAAPALHEIASSRSSSEGLSAVYGELGLHGLSETLRRQNLCFAAGIRRLHQLAVDTNLQLPSSSHPHPQQQQQQDLQQQRRQEQQQGVLSQEAPSEGSETELIQQGTGAPHDGGGPPPSKQAPPVGPLACVVNRPATKPLPADLAAPLDELPTPFSVTSFRGPQGGAPQEPLCIEFGPKAPAEWLGASMALLLQRPLRLQEALATKALLMLLLGNGSLTGLMQQIKQLLLFEDSHTAQALRVQLLQRLEQHAAEERQRPKTKFATPQRAAEAGRDAHAAAATATTAAAAAAEAALSKDIGQLLQGLLGDLPVSRKPAKQQQQEQQHQHQQQQQLLHIACRVRGAGPHQVAAHAAAAADDLMQRLDLLPAAPSPLQLFLNTPAREQYSAVFRFLIRLDAALSCLAECWLLWRQQQQQQWQQQQQRQQQQQKKFAARASQLQQRLQHFLRSVWDFILTEAIEAEWLHFRRQVAAAAATTVPGTAAAAAPPAEAEAAEVEAAEAAAAADAAAKGEKHVSFFSLVEAHARCIDSIYTRCLLSERLAPLRRKLEVILQCCWRLRSLMQRQQQQQQQQDLQQQDEQHAQRQVVRASLRRALSLATASSALPEQNAEASAAAAAAASELECLYFDYERSSCAFLRALLVLQPLQVLSSLLLRLNFNGVLSREAGSQRPL
ncbi:hypothetical protein Esti_004612 [Eimeria stiedai]